MAYNPGLGLRAMVKTIEELEQVDLRLAFRNLLNCRSLRRPTIPSELLDGLSFSQWLLTVHRVALEGVIHDQHLELDVLEMATGFRWTHPT